VPRVTTELVDLPPRFGMDRPAFDKIGSRPAGELRLAASVVLVRDAAAGPGVEVFLLERAAGMAFAAGMSVFPGGGLDAADREALAEGLVDAEAAEDAARSGDTAPDAAAALVACAVRETYEETGVLLGGAAPPAAGARERLVAREIGLREVVGHVDAAALRPWARWVTPEGMPRRYDTAFFVAGVPDGQEPDGATTEAVGAGWCAPAQALHEWEDGVRALMPPTWAVLSELAAADTAAGLLDAAAGRRPEPVTPSFRPEGERVGLAVPSHAFGGDR
jgi:8-oxo-dGTP pyrophosphatase MutT (NUDIX family)